MFDLIDIGVNLTHDSFDHDRDEIIRNAAMSGVSRMLVTGTSVAASAKACELSLRYPQTLYATAGVHPHHASEFDEHSAVALRELLANPNVVAVGECGLDFYRDFSPRDRQREAFSAQLDLAAETGLPVFLHQRDAHGEFVATVRAFRPRLSGGVAHCFTGGRGELADLLELDLHIGITGWVCDERRGRKLRSALPDIPLDRLLLETDAPYLLPRDLRPLPRNRRNEPAYLRHIAQSVATGMNRAVEAVAQAATENAERLFGLGPVRQRPLL